MTIRLFRFDPPFLLCDVLCAIMHRLHRVFLLGLCCLLLGFAGCCTEDRIVIELHHVELCNSQAEVIRAEKFIKDFGLEVDDIEFGCRNGTFINITVTGREKWCIERYRDEMRRRMELERRIREGKRDD